MFAKGMNFFKAVFGVQFKSPSAFADGLLNCKIGRGDGT